MRSKRTNEGSQRTIISGSEQYRPGSLRDIVEWRGVPISEESGKDFDGEEND